jgi:hypothetical protein
VKTERSLPHVVDHHGVLRDAACLRARKSQAALAPCAEAPAAGTTSRSGEICCTWAIGPGAAEVDALVSNADAPIRSGPRIRLYAQMRLTCKGEIEAPIASVARFREAKQLLTSLYAM